MTLNASGLSFPSIDRVLAARLVDDLTGAGYTAAAIEARLGDSAAAALRRGHRAPAMRALEYPDDPLGVLARLFALGAPVPRARLLRALPRFGVDTAIDVQLVAPVPDADTVVPLVELAAHDFVDSTSVSSWWIVSDLGEVARRGALLSDHVLGVGGATRTLAGLMIQTGVESVLDLGTGCGIVALLASRFAARVIATDISDRALRFAELNAQLNSVTNVEFRRGNLFAPVAGERFDRILSNPPFVITPRSASVVTEYDYRDAGMTGDALVEAVIRGVPHHLTPGGTAQLLGNWETLRDVDDSVTDGLARVLQWTDEAELDAWVIERERQDPSLYAETWIRDGGTVAGDEFDRLHEAWMADFDDRRVASIGFGYLTLQHRSRPPVARFERLPGTLGHNPQGLGVHIDRCLAAMRMAIQLTDDELGDSRLVVSPDVTEERHYWPGAEHPTVMSLHQGGGFGRTVPLDTGLAGLVGACDGELTLFAIIGALAQLLELDEAQLAAELLPRARDLISTGFLLLGDG